MGHTEEAKPPTAAIRRTKLLGFSRIEVAVEAPTTAGPCTRSLRWSPRLDLAFDLTSRRVLGGLQVVIRLEVRSELRARSKVPGQPKRRICGDGATATDDIPDVSRERAVPELDDSRSGPMA